MLQYGGNRMTMEPRISVVIPLYNKAPYIANAISSALMQDVPPAEIIVVDDGSTDGGGSVVEQFQENGVRLIRQDNFGVSAARNRGMQAATSEYVAFLDADDEWLPSHVQTLALLLHDFPGLGLYSTLHKVRRGGNCHVPWGNYSLGYRGPVVDFFEAMANGLSLVNSTTACAHRLRLLGVGGFPVGVRHGEDLIGWTKLATGFGMAHAAVVTAIYNRDAVNSATFVFEREPPGSLLYLAAYLRDQKVSGQHARSALRLFDRIAFFTAAGMKEAGDLSGIRGIDRVAKQNHMYGLRFRLALLELAPACLLTLCRRLRQGPVAQ